MGIGDEEPRRITTRLRSYVRANWLALFSAFVIGLGIPLWKAYVIEQPSLHVEITGLDVSAPDVPLKLDSPDLKNVADIFENSFVATGDDASVKLDKASRVITARKQSIDRETTRQADVRAAFSELQKKSALTGADVRTFASKNLGIFSVRDLPAVLGSDTGVLDSISRKLDEDDGDIAKAGKTVTTALAELEQYKAKLQTSEANVRVECAISNSGGGAISLRPQGLMRVSLGGSNYLDIQLRVVKYDEFGELQPKSSRVVTLASDPLQKLGDDERERVINYFRQSAPAELYLVDIGGNIYRSGVVPFARGLYDQSAYDALRVAAARHEPRPVVAGLFGLR